MAVSMLESIAYRNRPDAHRHYEKFPSVKKMVYLMEQFLLCDYVIMFSGSLIQNDSLADHSYRLAAPLLLREYRNELVNKALAIPRSDFHTGKYTHTHALMKEMAYGTIPSADDLIDIFMDSSIENDADIYMPKEFLLPFVYAINGTKIDKDRIPNSVDLDDDQYEFFNPVVYIPTFDISKELGYRLIMDVSEEFQVPAFIVEDFQDLRKNMTLPYRYIACLDWKGKSFQHVLGLLERFSIEHDKHVMQNDSVCTVGDICHDVITGSNYCRCCKPSNIQSFIHCLKYLVEKYSIQIDDTKYLGEILKYVTNVDQNIISFLQKPVESVTVAEMEAFNSSIFASFIHKTISATEATDPAKDEDEKEKENEDKSEFPAGNSKDEEADPGTDPNNEDAPTNPDEPADDDAGGTGDMDMGDLGGDDAATGDATAGDTAEESDEKETEEHKVARKIPPATDGILLELLNPENETLSDYLYRKEFLYRVNELLQNLSSNTRYSSQTLFMLKQWATKWLYIFSVSSLKSFLRNINFSIMSNK